MVVHVRVPSIDSIDLFKKYLYSVGLSEKKNRTKELHEKKVDAEVK